MELIDLTDVAVKDSAGQSPVNLVQWDICNGHMPYVANIYQFHHDGMVGTYLDFPGHIQETHDGSDAANYPLEKLFRLPARVIHLDRESGSGKVTADDLRRTAGGPVSTCALVINALGKRRYDRVANRSVYLTREAADFIIETGASLVVSDIYESDDDPQGIFPALFGAKISTVCYPVNLHLLPAQNLRITVLCARFPAVTQLPCRIVAEIE